MARDPERRHNGPISLVILLLLIAGGFYWCLYDENCTFLDPVACSMGVDEYCPNNPPVLIAVLEQTTRVGKTVFLALEAHDADGDALEFSAQGLPPGLAIDAGSGNITGAPTDEGAYDVRAIVTDSRSAPVTRRFRWVIEPQSAPALEPDAEIITPLSDMPPPVMAEAYFYSASAALKDDIGKSRLRPKAEEACAYENAIERVEIDGFVDDQESAEHPSALSEQRAQVVAEYTRSLDPACFEGAVFDVRGSSAPAPEHLAPGLSEFGAQRVRVTFYFAGP